MIMTAYVRSLIPNLEPHRGSWVVVDRASGKAVMETFNRKMAEAINQERYEVMTALEYLSKI